MCAIICKQNQKRISGSFEANMRLQLQNKAIKTNEKCKKIEWICLANLKQKHR